MAAISSIIGILLIGFGVSHGATFSSDDQSNVVSSSLDNTAKFEIESNDYMYVGNNAYITYASATASPSTGQCVDTFFSMGYPFSDNIADKLFFEWHVHTQYVYVDGGTSYIDYQELYFKRTRTMDDFDSLLDIPSNIWVTISTTCLFNNSGSSNTNYYVYSFSRTFDCYHLPSSYTMPSNRVSLYGNYDVNPNTPTNLSIYTSITFTTQLPDVDVVYTDGFDNGTTYGYQQGLGENGWRLDNYLYSIVDLPVLYLRSLFGFELYGGPSLFAILISLITLSMVIFVIRKFI